MKENERYDIDAWIAEYLSGGLDPATKAELEAWVNASEENRRYFLQREELWFSAVCGEELEKFGADKAFEAFRRRIKAAEAQPAVGQSRWRKALRYVAAVAVLCMAAHFSYRQGGQDLKDTLAWIEVEAPAGSQTRMRLPDSTLVVLNAGSRMVYAQDFGVESREVQLEGEGYFEVTRNERQPFRVSSENIALTVLGTKFNFRDYPQEDEVVVSLREGLVTLDNRIREEAPMALKPDERMVMDKCQGRMKRERMATDSYLKWMDGKLEFDGTPLDKVIQVLERSYDASIRLEEDSLAGLRLYGSFNRNEQGLSDILDILQATGKINYRLQKDSVIIIY